MKTQPFFFVFTMMIVKAVPLAVLIAMSPMTTANAETKPERIQPQEIEYVEIPSDQQPVRKEVMRLTYPNACEPLGDATIIFYDTDGNAEDAEETVLRFKKQVSPNSEQTRDYEVSLEYILMTEHTNSKTTSFVACGNGTISYKNASGKQITHNYANGIPIQEEFANYLYSIFDGELKIVKKKEQN